MSKQLVRSVMSALNGHVALLSPSHAYSLSDEFRAIAQLNAKEENEVKHDNFLQTAMAYGYNEVSYDKNFAYVDGIAFIPITGLLINRFNYSWSSLTGYNYIRFLLQEALDDDDVKLIVFDVNSGGGQVAGCFELANEIYASREIKPSLSMVDSYSYSAAYMLASSATKMVVTPTGNVGSIGALIAHFDYSKMMEDWGVKVTFIHSGNHKVDGNVYEVLSPKVKADMQNIVDVARKEFVDVVARNTGLEYQVVYDTEAQSYSATDALALGLINAVEPPQTAIMAFRNELASSQTTQEITMSTEKKEVPNAASETANTTEATAQTAVVSAEVTAAAKTEERTRINDILQSDEAKGKTALANHLALSTDMTVDAAKGILAKSPAEAAAPSATGDILATAMDLTGGGAQISADTNNAVASDSQKRASEIIASQNLALGVTATKH